MRRVRSGECGAYSWTGSLTGSGTSVMASMPIRMLDIATAQLLADRTRLRTVLVESDNMATIGVSLGQLLLALDATMVTPGRGAARAGPAGGVGGADRLRRRPAGPGGGAGSADVFFLLGVADDDALRWIDQQVAPRAPAAIFVKEPSDAVVARAVAAGTAVVAVEPQARWERLYRLVDHVFEHHGDRADPLYDSGTDLFGLAQSIADRTHGMVSIEDAQSHVLAYSASNDEADELRRLSILGRAGPPEHLAWIGQWGIFDALRAGGDVVRVDERPELGLRPRLAIGIHQPAAGPAPAPGVRRHHLGAAGLAAAGRRRRGGAARRRGAGGPDHGQPAIAPWLRRCPRGAGAVAQVRRQARRGGGLVGAARRPRRRRAGEADRGRRRVRGRARRAHGE